MSAPVYNDPSSAVGSPVHSSTEANEDPNDTLQHNSTHSIDNNVDEPSDGQFNDDASLGDVLQPERLAALLQQIEASVGDSENSNTGSESPGTSQPFDLDTVALSDEILRTLSSTTYEQSSLSATSSTSAQVTGSLFDTINNDSSQNVPEILPPPSPPPIITSGNQEQQLQESHGDQDNFSQLLSETEIGDDVPMEMSEFEIQELLDSVSSVTEQLQSQNETEGQIPENININALLDLLEPSSSDYTLTDEDLETLKFVQDQISNAKEPLVESSQPDTSSENVQFLQPPVSQRRFSSNRRSSFVRRPSTNRRPSINGLGSISEFSQRIKRASMSRRRFSNDAFLTQLKNVIVRDSETTNDSSVIIEEEERESASPNLNAAQSDPIPSENEASAVQDSAIADDDEALSTDFQEMLLNALQMAMESSTETQDNHGISDSITSGISNPELDSSISQNISTTTTTTNTISLTAPETTADSFMNNLELLQSDQDSSISNDKSNHTLSAIPTSNDFNNEPNQNDDSQILMTYDINEQTNLENKYTPVHDNTKIIPINENNSVSASAEIAPGENIQDEYSEADIAESLKVLQGLFQSEGDMDEDANMGADSQMQETEDSESQGQAIMAQLMSLLQKKPDDLETTDLQVDDQTQDHFSSMAPGADDQPEEQPKRAEGGESEQISDLELALAEAISKSLMDQLNLPQSDDEASESQSEVHVSQAESEKPLPSSQQRLPSSRPIQQPTQPASPPADHSQSTEGFEPAVDYEILLNALQQAIEEVSGTTAAAVASEAAGRTFSSASHPTVNLPSLSSQSRLLPTVFESDDEDDKSPFVPHRSKSRRFTQRLLSSSISSSSLSQVSGLASRRVSSSQDDGFSSADIEAALHSLFRPDGTLNISVDNEPELENISEVHPASQPPATEEEMALQSTASMVEALLQSGAISLEQLAALNRDSEDSIGLTQATQSDVPKVPSSLGASSRKKKAPSQLRKTVPKPKRQIRGSIQIPEISPPVTTLPQSQTPITSQLPANIPVNVPSIPPSNSVTPLQQSTISTTVQSEISKAVTSPATTFSSQTPASSTSQLSGLNNNLATAATVAPVSRPVSTDNSTAARSGQMTSVSSASLSIAETLARARANMRLRPSSSENKIDPMLARREMGIAALRARQQTSGPQAGSRSNNELAEGDSRSKSAYYHSFVRNGNSTSPPPSTQTQYKIYTPQSGPNTATNAQGLLSARASAVSAVGAIAASAASRLFNSDILANASRAVAASRAASVSESSSGPAEGSASRIPSSQSGARAKFFYYTPPSASGKRSDKPAPSFSTVPKYSSPSYSLSSIKNATAATLAAGAGAALATSRAMPNFANLQDGDGSVGPSDASNRFNSSDVASAASEEGNKGVAANVMAALLLARSVVAARQRKENEGTENADQSRETTPGPQSAANIDKDGDTEMAEIPPAEPSDNDQDDENMLEVDSSTMEVIQEAIQAILAEGAGEGDSDGEGQRQDLAEPDSLLTGSQSSRASPALSDSSREPPSAVRKPRGRPRTSSRPRQSKSSSEKSDTPARSTPKPEEILFPRPNVDGLSEKERARLDSRIRKKRWRFKNVDKNRDNDLRVRVVRRATQLFGAESTPEKEKWIENEFNVRRNKRLDKTSTAGKPFENNATMHVSALTTVTTVDSNGNQQRMQVMVPTSRAQSSSFSVLSNSSKNLSTSPTFSVARNKEFTSQAESTAQSVKAAAVAATAAISGKSASTVSSASPTNSVAVSNSTPVVMDLTEDDVEMIDLTDHAEKTSLDTSETFKSSAPVSPNKRKRSPSLDGTTTTPPVVGGVTGMIKFTTPAVTGPPSSLAARPPPGSAKSSLTDINRLAKIPRTVTSDINAPRANLIGSLTPAQVQNLSQGIPKPLPFVASSKAATSGPGSIGGSTGGFGGVTAPMFGGGNKPAFLSRFPRFNLNAPNILGGPQTHVKPSAVPSTGGGVTGSNSSDARGTAAVTPAMASKSSGTTKPYFSRGITAPPSITNGIFRAATTGLTPPPSLLSGGVMAGHRFGLGLGPTLGSTSTVGLRSPSISASSTNSALLQSKTEGSSSGTTGLQRSASAKSLSAAASPTLTASTPISKAGVTDDKGSSGGATLSNIKNAMSADDVLKSVDLPLSSTSATGPTTDTTTATTPSVAIGGTN